MHYIHIKTQVPPPTNCLHIVRKHICNVKRSFASFILTANCIRARSISEQCLAKVICERTKRWLSKHTHIYRVCVCICTIKYRICSRYNTEHLQADRTRCVFMMFVMMWTRIQVKLFKVKRPLCIWMGKVFSRKTDIGGRPAVDVCVCVCVCIYVCFCVQVPLEYVEWRYTPSK